VQTHRQRVLAALTVATNKMRCGIVGWAASFGIFSDLPHAKAQITTGSGLSIVSPGLQGSVRRVTFPSLVLVRDFRGEAFDRGRRLLLVPRGL